MTETEIRNEIERQATRRSHILAQLGHDRFAADFATLRDELHALDRDIGRLWENLRDARTRASLYCLTCNGSVARDARELHHKHSLVVLDAEDPSGLVTWAMVEHGLVAA